MKFIILVLLILIFVGFRLIIVPNVIKNHQEFVDFKSISLPTTPNYYLMCPEDFCGVNTDISPKFNMPVEELKAHWDNMIAKQPRVKLIKISHDKQQRLYVQLSQFWNFPDFIDVRFIPLNKNHSTIAIYSRSYFGHSDFGVNKKRVRKWIDM